MYHSHCLSCNHCELPLAKKGSIFQKDGVVYCKPDYLNFFCKRCTACAEHILKHCIRYAQREGARGRHAHRRRAGGGVVHAVC